MSPEVDRTCTRCCDLLASRGRLETELARVLRENATMRTLIEAVLAEATPETATPAVVDASMWFAAGCK